MTETADNTDENNAIGKQKARFELTKELFRDKAIARTNATAAMKFAGIRNTGYSRKIYL